MSLTVDQVIQLVNGVLADPTTSSKDHQAVVAKAISLGKEIEYQVKPAPAVAPASKKETSSK